MGRGKANSLGGLEGGVLVSLWVKFGGVLWTEEEGILEGGGVGFWLKKWVNWEVDAGWIWVLNGWL